MIFLNEKHKKDSLEAIYTILYPCITWAYLHDMQQLFSDVWNYNCV